MTTELYEACTRFVDWLERRVVVSARGDAFPTLDYAPSGRFWLGRLAPQEAVLERGLGERGERLDPCAIGLRAQLPVGRALRFAARIKAKYWDKRREESRWSKKGLPDLVITGEVPTRQGTVSFGSEDSVKAYAAAIGFEAFQVRVDVETRPSSDGRFTIATILIVNASPEDSPHVKDTNLYEVSFELEGLTFEPFQLEALPDSFRYDRRVGVYGVNCGIRKRDDGSLHSVDAPALDRMRPTYWTVGAEPPDLRFSNLSSDPLPAARHLLRCLRDWGAANWDDAVLKRRSAQGSWSPAMLEEAREAASEFRTEVERLQAGVRLLESDASFHQAFRLMNAAMDRATSRKSYHEWRPFQLGFLLANMPALLDLDAERDIADIVWFATGGGKTETYLGLILTAALRDRMRGKSTGLTAWSRFPLRMLSLQQTQRFADVLAAAELVRRENALGGEPFSLGFLVGQGATPNSLKPEPKEYEPDVDDDEMPAHYRVLLRCPFCGLDRLTMAFNRRLWRLEHRCTNDECEWPEEALPFYIVDHEIYRYLPTVIVGTLDKAAIIAMEASMRGLVGAPSGVCSEPGHGFTYAERAKRRHGCLVPDCRGRKQPLPMKAELFGPTLRLQDELHLLKDSLGAVDSNYEALYDGLQRQLCGAKPKILASSATLAGYRKQVDVLYRRTARIFPVPPPSAGAGFWTADSDRPMRRFVALAPRGVTLEYMIDNLVTTLQSSVRRLIEDPAAAASEMGVDASTIPHLISVYGTNVIYGNTLRDLDAVDRSLETQVQVQGGPINTDSLTSRRDFEDVREILRRLEEPEDGFADRLHVVTASSMMSHGVDIDRLNTMCILGMPLTTAEFMQATARVGRMWPGLVFVAMKMARERDAAIFRLFEKYVEQGDRFVEPVPVTRRSRRVLDRTVAGLELARILMIHEPDAGRSLVSLEQLRRYLLQRSSPASELGALADYLGLHGPLDERLKQDLEMWLDIYFKNLRSPPPGARFSSDLSPTGQPMMSLRDVEEQVQIFGSLTS
jgi:hypothetical protein